ncbi:TetR/AcrR family transcriptional regulator [Mycobacteroides chelonae]|uniref:TetR/AcrR family transcriptional regulator n=1 Tax=Mycobacteroides chelonae TaxID=1774 RepID=UPI0009C145B3|nr:TetR/AcrR family transcriptional regulator [Mycobacteroides chelonae]
MARLRSAQVVDLLQSADGRIDETLDDISRRIVDAATTCFAENGLAATTLNRVADSAGVGVATVHRRFGTKANLARYVLLTEAQRVFGRLRRIDESAKTPEEWLVGGFVIFADESIRSKMLVTTLRSAREVSDFTGLLTTDSLMVAARGVFMAGLIRWQQAGFIPHADVEVVAEVIARLIISLISNPIGAIPVSDVDQMTTFARTYIVPMLSAKN